MVKFWNRDTKAGGDKLASNIGAETVEEYLESGASVLSTFPANGDGFHRQKDDWESTEISGPDANTFLVLTDRNVLFIVGKCRDPSVEGDYVRTIPYEDITTVHVSDSLLSTKFSLETDDGVKMSFQPSNTDGLIEAEQFIQRARTRWRSAQSALTGLDTKLLDLEMAIVEGNNDNARQIRRELNDIIYDAKNSSSINEVTLDVLDDRLDAAEKQIKLTQARGHYRRGVQFTTEAADSIAIGQLESAIDKLEIACEGYRTASDILAPSYGLDDLDIDTTNDEAQIIELLGECCAATTTVNDHHQAVACWQGLYNCYSSLLAILNFVSEMVQATVVGVKFQLVWISHQLADVLLTRAVKLVSEGDTHMADDDSEAARKAYQTALDLLERREALDPPVGRIPSQSEIDSTDLEEKIARTAWRWGDNGE